MRVNELLYSVREGEEEELPTKADKRGPRGAGPAIELTCAFNFQRETFYAIERCSFRKMGGSSETANGEAVRK